MINGRKIVDCFLFFNELEPLNIRLNILNDVVDEFIIIESTLTFQNNPKPLFYENNKHLFEKFHHKIKHYVLKDISIPQFNYFEIEWYQRNYIINTLKHCSDSDIIFISDLDEIWNPIKLEKNIKTIKENQVYKWGSKLCYFYFNLVADVKQWFQPVFLTYSHLKHKLNNGLVINDITQQGKNQKDQITYEKIPNAGWHFSYLEDPEYKLKSFSHSEHKDKKYEYLMDCVKQMKNPFHSNDMYVIPENELSTYLPPYIFNNLDKYKKWIYNEKLNEIIEY